MPTKKRALIIRFSSFGDIVQNAFVAESLTNYKTDLLTKTEFANAFKTFSVFDEIIDYNKNTKIKGLFSLAKHLKQKNYSLIYDAHNNQRTLILKIFLCLLKPSYFLKLRTRSKFRLKRILLFKLRINLFPKPFKGAESFLTPLKLNSTRKDTSSKESNEQSNNTLLFAPSAAWDLKKWPVTHWIELANRFKDHDIKFIGGPGDTFIEKIQQEAPHTKNLAGKLSWAQTIEEIKNAKLLISGDTGVLHVADFYSVPAIALMGPSAFGYPTRESSKVISLNLPCQPCTKDGRGKCRIKEKKKCLTHITPQMVTDLIKKDH